MPPFEPAKQRPRAKQHCKVARDVEGRHHRYAELQYLGGNAHLGDATGRGAEQHRQPGLPGELRQCPGEGRGQADQRARPERHRHKPARCAVQEVRREAHTQRAANEQLPCVADDRWQCRQLDAATGQDHGHRQGAQHEGVGQPTALHQPRAGPCQRAQQQQATEVHAGGTWRRGVDTSQTGRLQGEGNCDDDDEHAQRVRHRDAVDAAAVALAEHRHFRRATDCRCEERGRPLLGACGTAGRCQQAVEQHAREHRPDNAGKQGWRHRDDGGQYRGREVEPKCRPIAH